MERTARDCWFLDMGGSEMGPAFILIVSQLLESIKDGGEGKARREFLLSLILLFIR